MDWQKLTSAKRLGSSKGQIDRVGRSEFVSDVDRITFSGSFRRLSRKTQVHPLAGNDHTHNRLTHSLEVSRVGYTLGCLLHNEIKTNPKLSNIAPISDDLESSDFGYIVQAACLAHDLGNPPFGHAGEDAVIQWFKENNNEVFSATLTDKYRRDLTQLEGNAQGFRLITQLENYFFSGGLKLTYATLGAFQKYPRTSEAGKKKFGAYISEAEILDEVMSSLDIPKINGEWVRHPLSYLVEAADDICYAVTDAEDAVELGILRFDEVSDILMSGFEKSVRLETEKSFELNAHRVNFTRMRGRVFDAAINSVVDTYSESYEGIMSGDYGYNELLKDNSAGVGAKAVLRAKELGSEKIFNSTRKVELEIGCYSAFDILLRNFTEAAIQQSRVLTQGPKTDEIVISSKHSKVLKLMGNHAPNEDNAPEGGWTEYQCIRRAIDFVSGMTDNYATHIAAQMRGAGI